MTTRRTIPNNAPAHRPRPFPHDQWPHEAPTHFRDRRGNLVVDPETHDPHGPRPRARRTGTA